LHRLENKLPTAIQLGKNSYFVFDEQGGTNLSTNLELSPRLRKCWALADSNQHIDQPCEPFQGQAERVIQTTSPKAERWKEWSKQKSAFVLLSDLPSVPEIAAIV